MDEEKEDRISLLPDRLLLEIISRLGLSTKQVIKTTSTISKRWQHLWTKLPTRLFIYKDDVTDDNTEFKDYFSFIDKILTQYPTPVNLEKFKLQIGDVPRRRSSQVNSWIRYAITHNVQEIDLRIIGQFSFNSFFFNNSSVISMKLSDSRFKPNGAIRWDKLKYLCIDKGELGEDTLGKILSGSPCLDTLELNNFPLVGRIQKSLFGSLVVLERFSCNMKTYKRFRYDDELLLDDAYTMSMKLSRCASNPPNGDIRWDELKCLCIDEGILDEDSILDILSGSPCLEILELKGCSLSGRIRKSLFGNFGVLEHLSCDLKTYERFSYDDELFLDDAYSMGMKLSRRVFNPPNGAIRWDKLYLRISREDLTEDSIEKILSRNQCLETLELDWCSGFRRIDVTSKSVKNLVLSGYRCSHPKDNDYIDTLKINAPYILSLTIQGEISLEKILLENVSSLVKAELNYQGSDRLATDLGLDQDDIEEELLRGLLSSLGHVNEIVLVGYNCLKALYNLEAKGFEFLKGSDRRGIYRSRVFPLIHK